MVGLEEGGTCSEALDLETPAVTSEPLGCFQGKTERVLIIQELVCHDLLKKECLGIPWRSSG